MAGIATTRILGVLLRVLRENRLLAGFAWVLHCFSQFLPQNLPFEIAVSHPNLGVDFDVALMVSMARFLVGELAIDL